MDNVEDFNKNIKEDNIESNSINNIFINSSSCISNNPFNTNNIEVNKDDNIFNSNYDNKKSITNINTNRISKSLLVSDDISYDMENHINKIMAMVDQTKFLKEEFVESNKVLSNSKEDLIALNVKLFDLLKTFADIESALYQYIESIEFISKNKKKEIKNVISEKLLNNYVSFSENTLVFIKELEKKLSIEYTIFSGNLDAIKSLEAYFGIKIEYSRLEPQCADTQLLSEQLEVMESDLFISFLSQVENNLNVNTNNLPNFLLSSFKKLINEKLVHAWQLTYEIPMKKIKLKNNYIYEFLSDKFGDLINDKFNLFDFDMFSLGERILLFEMLFYSCVPYVQFNDFSRQTFLNNIKKYLFILGIQDKIEDYGELVVKLMNGNNKDDKFTNIINANDMLLAKIKKFSECLIICNSNNTENNTFVNIKNGDSNDIISTENKKMFDKANYDNFDLDKFLLAIFSYSIMLNNLMTYVYEDTSSINLNSNINSSNKKFKPNNQKGIKICFVGELNCSARERQLMINLFNNLDLYLTKPSDISTLEINNICENFVYEPLVKSFSRYMFDENNFRKIELNQEELVNIITDFENYDSSIIKEKYLYLISNEAKFTTETFSSSSILSTFNSLQKDNNNDKKGKTNKPFNNISKKVNSVFSYVSNKLGISNDNKTQIDISRLRLYPYDYVNCSTHICICIGGAIVGKGGYSGSIWKKTYLLNKNNIDFYFFDWISNNIPGLSFYLLDFLPKDDFLYEKKNFKSSLELDNLLYFKEKTITNQNFKNSKIIGKLLAYFLASKMFFSFQSISLIGYSLGANVIKYCIIELYKMKITQPQLVDLIQNIVFLGGAATFNESDIYKDLEIDINNNISNNEYNDLNWSEVLSIVSGKIVNCYSTKDLILDTAFEKFINVKKPLGVKKVSITDKEGKEMILNYDFSNLKLSHYEYSNYVDKILKKINIL